MRKTAEPDRSVPPGEPGERARRAEHTGLRRHEVSHAGRRMKADQIGAEHSGQQFLAERHCAKDLTI
jgi:hypothetical protein